MNMKKTTRMVHTEVEYEKTTGSVATPIYTSTTYHQHFPDKPQEFDYIRSGNPTRRNLEKLIADLESGAGGFAFSSGMAATTAVLNLFKPSDHIILSDDIYGGTYRVITKIFSKWGLEFDFVDTTDLSIVKKYIKKNTKGVFIETPSNPLLKITDIQAMSQIARKKGILTIVDNTFMTPYYQNPIGLGADIVVHSATKYLGGHSDVLGGLAVVNSKKLAEELYFIQNATGGVLSPFDSFLTERGIKTLKVRMEQIEKNATQLACWLRNLPEVKEVQYPGFKDHKGYEIHKKQAGGFGGIIALRLKDKKSALKFIKKVKLPVVGVSLGAVETILTYPATMSHASIPEAERKKKGITDDLLRVSVGIEDIEDLKKDFSQALK